MNNVSFAIQPVPSETELDRRAVDEAAWRLLSYLDAMSMCYCGSNRRYEVCCYHSDRRASLYGKEPERQPVEWSKYGF